MILLLLLFFAYVAYVWARFGVLSSISASSYWLEGNERYIFTGWLVSLAVATYLLELGFPGHLMAVGFALAGMSVDHKRGPGLEDEFHTAGTLLVIGAGLYAAGWIAAGAFLVGTLGLKLFARNWIWWAEILAVIVIGLKIGVL